MQPTVGWNNNKDDDGREGEGGVGQRAEQTTIEGECLMLYTSAPTEVSLVTSKWRQGMGIRGDILSGEGVSFRP